MSSLQRFKETLIQTFRGVTVWRRTGAGMACRRHSHAARQANDFNDVTDAFVTGLPEFDEIGSCVVRVSYFMEYVESRDGKRERKVVELSSPVPASAVDNLLVMQKALKEMRAMPGAAEAGTGCGDALSDPGPAAPSLRWRGSRIAPHGHWWINADNESISPIESRHVFASREIETSAIETAGTGR